MPLKHFLKTGAPRSRSLCFFEQFPHTRSPPFSARALPFPGCGGSCLRTSSPPEATGVNWRPSSRGLTPGPAAPEGNRSSFPSIPLPSKPMLGLIAGSVRVRVFPLPPLLVRALLSPPLPLLPCVLGSFALSPRVSISFPFGEPGCCSMWSQLLLS